MLQVAVNFVVISLALVAAAPQTQNVVSPGRDTLGSLLHVLNRYADLYRDSALRFACDESITYWKRGGGGGRYDLEYLYVFTPGTGLTDYRTKHGADHREAGSEQRVDLTTYKLPSFVERAYSWVFTFERGKWALHEYKVIGQATILGRDSEIVSFVPRPPYLRGVNDWIGQVWVDRTTHQLLKVEALQVDQNAEKLQLEADLASTGSFPDNKLPTYYFSKVTKEFGQEKNGLRFPSRVEIVRSRFDVHVENGHRSATEQTMYRVKQEYSDYRFFSVRTLDEVKNYILQK